MVADHVNVTEIFFNVDKLEKHFSVSLIISFFSVYVLFLLYGLSIYVLSETVNRKFNIGRGSQALSTQTLALFLTKL